MTEFQVFTVLLSDRVEEWIQEQHKCHKVRFFTTKVNRRASNLAPTRSGKSGYESWVCLVVVWLLKVILSNHWTDPGFDLCMLEPYQWDTAEANKLEAKASHWLASPWTHGKLGGPTWTSEAGASLANDPLDLERTKPWHQLFGLHTKRKVPGGEPNLLTDPVNRVWWRLAWVV